MNSASQPIVSERIQGMVMGAAGIGMLVISVLVGYAKSQFLEHARRAEGTVTALEAGTSHLRIEFVDDLGNRVMFPGNGWVSHRVGDRVQVVYSKDDPIPTAELDEPGSIWSWTTSIAVIGFALTAAGAYTLRKRQEFA
jgi:hypothetical protein